MKKKRSNRILTAALIVLALIFVLVAVRASKATYDRKVAEEKLTEVDFYSMQSFCGENAKAVMDALKSGSKDKLASLMPGASGVEDVMEFADWSKADFKKAESMGAGSLTASPDESGKMDISERFFVEVGDKKYVLFIETLTSRWGRKNEGVSAVGVTTYEHFDDTGFAWNGEADDHSALAGELWWNK